MMELVERLRIEGPALSQAVLDEMYRDPFWAERFGAKGRRHADEDSDFHLRYLARALAAGDPAVLVRYAVWLREVLATRGMCSRHLAENFRLLGARLAQQGWPGVELAVAFLDRARQALAWEGAAGRLEQQADEIAQAVSVEPLAAQARDLLSYVGDAVALSRPDLFASHVAWLDAHLERRGVPRGQLASLLGALQTAATRMGAPPEALACLRGAGS